MSETLFRSARRLKTPYRWLRLAGGIGGGAVLDLVLPPTCRLCNRPVGGECDFCGPCLQHLTASEPMMRAGCRRCGRPRAKIRAGTDDGQPADARKDFEPCVQCKREKLAFDQVIPLWSYQDRVCEAIVAAKYGHQSPLGAALGRRLAAKVLTMTRKFAIGDAMSAKNAPPDLVTYVPSHFTRRFQRGGNGNWAIAEAVSRHLRAREIPVRCRSLLRMTRRIKKQAWLDVDERRANVRGAFAVKRSYLFAKTLSQRHILLVDDVLTTGATANEITRVLLDSGAKRVTLAVVARALRSQ